MRAEIATHTVRQSRRALVGWGAGMVLLALVMLSVFPTVKDSAARFDDLLKDYPEAFKAFFGVTELDYSTGVGYLSTELFGLTLPLILLILAVGRGASALGGEEERGTLALLLAQPVSRRRVVLEQAGAAGAVLGLVALVAYVSIVAGDAMFGLGVSPLKVAAAVLLAVLLAADFGALAVLAGAWTGRRGRAIAMAAAVAVTTWVLDALAQIAHWLSAARWVSPFAYYREADAVHRGLAPVQAAVLLAFAVVFVAAAVHLLERRDVTGG